MEKNVKFSFSHFMFSSPFKLFPTFLEKKNFGGGGGWEGTVKKYPFTYWLNGRWFLQIVDREF